MLKTYLAVALVACFLWIRNAQAFLDPPYVTPEHPTSGETVSVNIRGGICDGVGTIPGYPQITQQGSAIRIVLWGVHSTDPILCNIPIGTVTYTVGAHPPGPYTVQLDRDYQGDLGEILTETLGILPFTVTGEGAPPVALPATDLVSLGILGSMVFLGALKHLRRPVRRRR